MNIKNILINISNLKNKKLNDNNTYKINALDKNIYKNKNKINIFENLKDKNNILLKNKYNFFFKEIFNYMLEKELLQKLISEDIFKINMKTVNYNMRIILFDWIEEISIKFNLNVKTTIICFELIDLFTCYNIIKKEDYQLVGIVCLFISSKYEDIYSINLNKIIKLCDNVYEKINIIEKEYIILKFLDYNLNRIYRIDFYYFFTKLANINEKIINFGLKILEVTFLTQHFYKYKPSVIGFSLTYLIIRIYKLNCTLFKKINIKNNKYFKINYNLIKYEFDSKIIVNCSYDIYKIYTKWKNSNFLNNIYKKYFNKKYSEASKFILKKN